MARKHISAAAAKANFAAVLDAVQHRGETYVVERHGKEVAVIVGIENAESLAAPQSEHPQGALALLGLWADVPDNAIDALIDDLREARESDRGRAVSLEP